MPIHAADSCRGALLCLLTVLTVLAGPASGGQTAASADSVRFIVESGEDHPGGWFSIRSEAGTDGATIWSGHASLGRGVRFHWSYEVGADGRKPRHFRWQGRNREGGRIETDADFTAGAYPVLSVRMDGQAVPMRPPKVPGDAFIFPGPVAPPMIVLSEYLRNKAPDHVEELKFFDLLRRGTLVVKGRGATTPAWGEDDVRYRTFDLTFSWPKTADTVEMTLYQTPDGELAGIERKDGPTAHRQIGDDSTSWIETDVAVVVDGEELAAVLTLPREAPGATPGLVLAAGPDQSGPDADRGAFPFYAHVARELAARGFAVLRYAPPADLGGGDVMGTLARAAAAAVASLAASPSVGGGGVGLLGHGRGSLLLAEAAARARADSLDLSCLIVLGGAGVSGEGLAVADPPPADAAWAGAFRAYDPAPHLPALDLPVLILHGDRDVEVDPARAEDLAALLRAAGNRRVATTVAKGLNHLFQKAESGAREEYGSLEPACAPAILERVGSFLRYSARSR